MARRWTKEEELEKRAELFDLYVQQNKSIREISKILRMKENSVYDRLIRLKIPTQRINKTGFNNINRTIIVPTNYSADLAEFIGILLGDGHITPTQVTVTLGTKEYDYVKYVILLIQKLFRAKPKRMKTKRGDVVVYFGSTVIVRWLMSMGLVRNKVKSQVGIPFWCLGMKSYMISTLRGLIDTDGSVYRLKSGLIQISFTNRSWPLLNGVKKILTRTGFHPSQISGFRLYLTRKQDILRYQREVGFRNAKHSRRFLDFLKNSGGSYSGNYTAL